MKNGTTEVEPFVLHRNDDKQFLCPIRAYLRWLDMRDSGPGPFFLADKQGVMIAGSPLVYNAFNYRLEVELQQIGIRNWSMYCTHSFRRGGSQFYLSIRGKPLTDICAWGGWTDMSTALRYIIGTDNKLAKSRQEFTRPETTGICSMCRRGYYI
jgi:hypothetical protein